MKTVRHKLAYLFNFIGGTFFVQDQYGQVKLYYVDGMKNLKLQVYAETGIPEECQRFLYNNSLLTEENIIMIPNGSTIILSLALKGGGNNCEICFENGVYICKDCDGKILCGDCCKKFHKHPDRSSHDPELLQNSTCSSEQHSALESSCQSGNASNSASNIESYSNSWDDEFSASPNTSTALEEACMVMTLTETFNITRFREYQRKTIKALCSGNDCLVIQPTGSGKSLYFQFPSVYTNKIAIVITPTISLMQDHVTNCEKYGIKAVFLGSAQLDLNAEEHVLSGESDAKIVLVTPEWISKPDKKKKKSLLLIKIVSA